MAEAQAAQDLAARLTCASEGIFERKKAARDLGDLLQEAVSDARQRAWDDAYETGGAEAVAKLSVARGHHLQVPSYVAEAIPSLVEALNDNALGVRAEVVRVLGRLGGSSEPAVSALAQLLSGDAESEVRWTVAASLEALGKVAAPSVPQLAAALKDASAEVRLHAASALGAIGQQAEQAVPVLIEVLTDPGWVKGKGWAGGWVAGRAALALARVGEAASCAISPLTVLLRAQDRDAELLEAAARALGQFAKIKHSAAAAALAVALADQNRTTVRVRKVAAEALGNLGKDGDRYTSVLATALQDVVDDVRVKAAEALGTLGIHAAAAMPHLVEVMQKDGQADVRREAAKALGNIGGQACIFVPELCDALEADADIGVRCAAARSLGALGACAAPAVARLAAHLLSGPPAFEQLTAMHALGRLAGASAPAAPALANLVQSGATSDLRACAART
eukprot:CAMPEP_0168415664 /NCGR_PEP_ID=MMETSP0228-20121227/30346_1 /TAXON_ID=133427 /ORGANISM="Protoceratium reticulatum, Strain CCCM 535 (=CCMP 1889)" /LENGTH=451 /DNA_ID=CAMNT_0008429475 /DNA_START=42 /DNA_END=1393 /DNA_ORIENTATION=+